MTLAASERDLGELAQQQEQDQHDGDVAGRIGQHVRRADASKNRVVTVI
jgi:hypothetical protein